MTENGTFTRNQPTGRKRQRVLVFTASSVVAGAEKIICDIIYGLKAEYEFSISTVYNKPTRNDIFEQSGQPKASIRSIFFGNYKIIHTHLFLPALIIRTIRLFTKNFSWVHTVHYESYKGLRFGQFRKFLDHNFIYPDADHLIAVSSAVSATLSHFNNHKLINNGVSLSNHTEHRKAFNSQYPVIGTIAMHRDEKGLEDLIYIAKNLSLTLKKFKLKIAGDGPLFDKHRKLISKLKLDSHIELCGYVKDIDSFYKSLDIYVQPSVTESFGLSAMQAFQYALPIITTEAGNLQFLMKQGEFGTIVSRTNTDLLTFRKKFSDAIIKTIKNYEKETLNSKNALIYWEKLSSVDAMTSAYRRLYALECQPTVCIVAPIVTHSVGGLQRQIYLQSQIISKLGYSVYILQRTDLNLKKTISDWQHVQFLQTPYLPFNKTRHSIVVNKMNAVLFIACGFIYIFLRRQKISIIHAHQISSPTILGTIAKLMLNIPFVVKVTSAGRFGEANEAQASFFIGHIRKWALSYADRVIALTEDMKSEILSLGISSQNIINISNSVALPTSTPTLNPTEEFKILYSGRLSQEKNIETLLRAFSMLIKSHPDVKLKLDVIGATFYEREPNLLALTKLIENQGPCIKFHGHISDPTKYYISTDVFVLPSISEGMSNSLLEAMSHAKCCVVSNIPANTSLIENEKNGLTFSTLDANDLHNRLSLLVDDKLYNNSIIAKRLGCEARKSIENLHSQETVGTKIVELYEQILHEGHREA
jgi:glycosyltransferase involved in cell wall biosynthesis